MRITLEKGLLKSLLILGSVVEARDAYTGGHLWRVGQYSRLLATKAGLDPQDVFVAAVGGFLHDLGKVGVSDAILNKTGKLTDDEYIAIKTHPLIGRDLIRAHPLADLALAAIASHHERPDQGGYPFGLTQEQTPLVARIVGVADAFDAMTSTRPYRKGMPVAKALSILREEQGRQFDGTLVGHFITLEDLGLLQPIVGHSDFGRKLVVCPGCGPVIAVPAGLKDGDAIHCRVCQGKFTLHQDGDTFAPEFLGVKGSAEAVKPEAETAVIEQFLTHVPQTLHLPDDHQIQAGLLAG